MPASIVITGSDSGYFQFGQELVKSLFHHALPTETSVGYLDFGLEVEQLKWLRSCGVLVSDPWTDIDYTKPDRSARLPYLCRPFLREAFPGFAQYMWMDADTWVQTPAAVETFLEALGTSEAAIVSESDPGYRFRRDLFMWKLKNFVHGYGPVVGVRVLARPHLNNGVFAMRSSAPHWDVWVAEYRRAMERTDKPGPHDQFSLNVAVRTGNLPTIFLPATSNWICDLGMPHFNVEHGVYCTPDASHRPIDVLHLAGFIKTTSFDTPTSDGGRVRGMLRFGAPQMFLQ